MDQQSQDILNGLPDNWADQLEEDFGQAQIIEIEDESPIFDQPTQQQINNCLLQVQNNYPSRDLLKIFQILYQRLVVNSQNLSEREPSITSRKSRRLDFDQRSNNKYQARSQCSNRPKFEVREIVTKARSKKMNETADDRDWLKMKPDDGRQMLSGQVWDRYGRKQDKSEKMSTTSKIQRIPENQENLKRSTQWDLTSNKQYRLYANKVAPKFNSKDQQRKFFDKRLAAKAFCERGYGYPRIKEEFLSNNVGKAPAQANVSTYYATSNAPIHQQENQAEDNNKSIRPHFSSYLRPSKSHYIYPDKKRYKTVSTAFVAEAVRKFEIFIMENVDRKIRPLTGPQMRHLYSVLLNAEHQFSQEEYDTFRKFVKLTFDLGSVSVYQRPSKTLYKSIQVHLKERINDSLSDTRTMVSDYPLEWIQAHNQNMRAYAESVGYVELQDEQQFGRPDYDVGKFDAQHPDYV